MHATKRKFVAASSRGRRGDGDTSGIGSLHRRFVTVSTAFLSTVAFLSVVSCVFGVKTLLIAAELVGIRFGVSMTRGRTQFTKSCYSYSRGSLLDCPVVVERL